VIILTGHGTDEDERTVRQLGAFDYLHKPVDIKTLVDKIKAASQRAKLLGEEGHSGQNPDSDKETASGAEDD